MRKQAARVATVAALSCVSLAGVGAEAASAHQDGCHSAHSCPSDHHTYVWFDGNGQGWSCARPGSDSYDPTRDTTTITYDGHTYYCYLYGSAPPPPPDTDGDGNPDSSDACPFEAASTLDGCPPPAPTKPRGLKSYTESSGGFTAELSYLSSNRYPGTKEVRIKIAFQGTILRDERVLGPDRRFPSSVAFPIEGADALLVRDLDGDGAAEVKVDMFSGGANCCAYSVIYSYVAERYAYERLRYTWGSGYRLKDLDADGLPEFIGADRRFRYEFACGACAIMPPRIWVFRHGAVNAVTAQFPKLIRMDARRQYRILRQNDDLSYRGALAGWTADMCLLDQCRKAFRAVNRALRHGNLAKRARYDFPPFGRAFVRKLHRLLRRYGYL